MQEEVKQLKAEKAAPQPQAYSQPAPQPQSYDPPARKISWWERTHDIYRAAHKTQKMYRMLEASDGSRKSMRRLDKYYDKYDNEMDAYENKYNVQLSRFL